MSFFVRDYPVLTKVPSRIPGLCSLDVSTLPSSYDNQNYVFNANILPRESKVSLEAFHLQFKAPNLEVFPSVCSDYILISTCGHLHTEASTCESYDRGVAPGSICQQGYMDTPANA